MYKCVRLLLDVLNDLTEWDSLLLVSSLMYRSPDSGKYVNANTSRSSQYLFTKYCTPLMSVTHFNVPFRQEIS